MTQIDILSLDAIESLRADHKKLRLEVLRLTAMVRALGVGGTESTLWVAKTDASGIDAMSGDTPGSGTGTLYRLNRSSGDVAAVARDVTIYNIAEAVAATTYIAVAEDVDGVFWVLVEKCG